MAWTAPRDWTNGEIVTQTMLNTDVRDNMKELWHEVAYVEFAADVSVTSAHTELSPVDVVSAGALTYDALPTLIEFYVERLDTVGTTVAALSLWDGSTDLGRIGEFGAAAIATPLHLPRRLTPSAASHTYKVRGWLQTGANTCTLRAGAGGVGTRLPGFIRVLQRGG